MYDTSSFLHVVHPTPIVSGDQPPCDAWHTTGNPDWHRNDQKKAFRDLCKSKITKIEEVIKVGGTGYPIAFKKLLEKHKPNGPCWTQDSLGRFYLLTGLDDIPLIFQRYTAGDTLMGLFRNEDGEDNWDVLGSEMQASLGKDLGILV